LKMAELRGGHKKSPIVATDFFYFFEVGFSRI